jgi:hypothetical protein
LTVLTKWKNVPTDAYPNLEEEIWRRAFELYEERGREHGHEIEGWVRAESQVIGTAA